MMHDSISEDGEKMEYSGFGAAVAKGLATPHPSGKSLAQRVAEQQESRRK